LVRTVNPFAPIYATANADAVSSEIVEDWLFD
jgi:hypothetical protein